MQELFAILSQPLALVLVLLGFVAIVYLYGMSGYWVIKRMNVPGAKPLPYVGNLRDMAKSGGVHLGILQYYRKYGKIFSLCFGRETSIAIADPEVIKQIMVKDFHNFPNHYSEFPIPKRQKGMFTAEGEDWKRIRSTLTPVFTSGKLKVMVPLIEKSCNTLVEKIGDIADTGKSVDFFSWFGQMTLEVILSTAFGIQSDIQSDPDNKIIAKTKEVFKSPTSLRIIMMLPFRNFIVKIFRFLSGNVVYFRTIANEILKARKAQDIQGTRDLVDIMLTAKNPDGSRRLSDDEIVSQSITFLLAGQETSSNTLTMTAYYLAVNPDIQERLRYEILVAQQTNPGKAIYDLLPELEYLECVINEVLRLSPPAHMTNRRCTNEYTFNGITIPAGMQIVIPIYTLHRDPEAWPDPDKFDPERFRGPAKESRHPFQFLPFGEGPRNCIGKRFALMEVKITLVNILSKYKFVRCPETQVPLKMIPGVTLIPKDGVFLRIESCK